MKAWVIDSIVNINNNSQPLKLMELPNPIPNKHEVLLKVSVCGMCHTELDEIEGRTPPPAYPIIPGHQVVGKVVEKGEEVSSLQIGDRVGVAWIYSCCGTCKFCKQGLDNLCEKFTATGRDAHGGYAEFMVINQDFAFPIPNALSDVDAAPLLCAGAIGYRSLRLTGISDGQKLGLTGFGASAHLVLKMVKFQFPQTKIYVFARKEEEQIFALELGAFWAGNTTDNPPEKLHAIIDTTPAWLPITAALQVLEPGGRLVINAIRKEKADQQELLKLSYEDHLWMEKEIKSVANITRKDVSDFLAMAATMKLKPKSTVYPFESANDALFKMRTTHAIGSKVLQVE